MISHRFRQTSAAYLVGDLAALSFAFFVAWALRFQLQIVPLTKTPPDFGQYLPLLPMILFSWPVVFYFHGLYQIRRARTRFDEALTIVLAAGLGTILLLAFTTAYRPAVSPDSPEFFSFSRIFLALFPLVSIGSVTAMRMLIRQILRRRHRNGQGIQRVLIIGAGALGKEITQKILAHREFGIEIAGFLDDDPGMAGSSFYEVPVLGTLKDLDVVLEREQIGQVFIALPLEAHHKMLKLLQRFARECVDVKLVPDILQYATINAAVEDLDGTPVINLSQVPLQGWYSMAKRAMDIALASLAMLALLPFLPFVALVIWLEDRGPIFYSQERMGLDGKSFMIYKLRSMKVNAEASTGPVWAVKDDPRRTRLGSFLRRTSMDELPQVWNVLKGDMSIVGPRPERPAFVREFKHKIPQYMMRHRVKSGITGWAQVHGWRGNTSIRKRIQYDLYYIQNWSLLLDVKILWMTIRSGLWHNAH
ncbi:MAG: undecaprenyl-phosphate glucose phosphotransferase [Deltaproteobacteria bacterium]|nr:undecaprenyl-phosphate glucose phosphotransferase [Deltaproteobacteria bacterium]